MFLGVLAFRFFEPGRAERAPKVVPPDQPHISVFLALRGPPTLEDAHGQRGLGALAEGQVGLHPDLVDGLAHKVEQEPGRELLPAPIWGIPLARVLEPCPGTARPGVSPSGV